MSEISRNITIWGYLVEIVIIILVYCHLKKRIKNNEVFSSMGWGFFVGLFMGGIGDFIFYYLISNLLSKQLVEWNSGKSKMKQNKNIETVKVVKRKLWIGLMISFVLHIIIQILLLNINL